ncbi:MAG: hypothetical protein ACKVZJ_05110 [Phycisphaerales bacterium]
MKSLRHQLTLMLAVWLVAFPLPPIFRGWAGIQAVKDARASEPPADPVSPDSIRDVNLSVWQSLFNEPFNDTTSYYWLDAVLDDADTYVTGTTSSQRTFGFAISIAHASAPVGGEGDRIAVCAGVLTTNLADRPVMAVVATKVWPATGQLGSAIMVIDDLPDDSPLFAISTLGLAGAGPGVDSVEEFVEQQRQAQPIPVGCTSGCRYTQAVNDALAEAEYQAAKTAAETTRDAAEDAAIARKDAATAAARQALKLATAAIALTTGACMLGCFGFGPAFWLCQAGCIAVGAIAAAAAILAIAQQVSSILDTFTADILAADDLFQAQMQQARTNRDNALAANAKIAACCVRQCEGLECPPENVTLPPMPH